MLWITNLFFTKEHIPKGLPHCQHFVKMLSTEKIGLWLLLADFISTSNTFFVVESFFFLWKFYTDLLKKCAKKCLSAKTGWCTQFNFTLQVHYSQYRSRFAFIGNWPWIALMGSQYWDNHNSSQFYNFWNISSLLLLVNYYQEQCMDDGY